MPAVRTKKCQRGPAPQACVNGRLSPGFLRPLDATGEVVRLEPRHHEERRSLMWCHHLTRSCAAIRSLPSVAG